MNPWRRERDEQGRKRRGAWSQDITGGVFWPIDPRPDEIRYDAMCVGLARAYRYRGQTIETYSVAEHSVIVSQYAYNLACGRNLKYVFGADPGGPRCRPLDAARYGLLHDAQESFIGDVARPLKRQRCMKGYRKVEALWEAAIIEHFNLHVTPEIKALVKEVDDRIVLDEVEALFLDPDMWSRTNRYPGLQPLGCEIAALPWRQAADVFTKRFTELFPEYGRKAA